MRYWNIAPQRYCRRLARCWRALRLSADRAANSPAHSRGKPGLLTHEDKVPRDTDCLLEGGGFEPSVPVSRRRVFDTILLTASARFGAVAKVGLAGRTRPLACAMAVDRVCRAVQTRGLQAWVPDDVLGVRRHRRSSIRRAWSSHHGSGTWHPRQTSRRCHPGRC
jgi:hypothetical protein